MSFAISSVARPGAAPATPRQKFRNWPFCGTEAGAVLRLACPIVMIVLINMGMSVTDTMMVSWFFGAEALAAVAVGSDLYSIVFYLGAGIIGGLSPFFAEAVARRSVVEQIKYRLAGWFVTGTTAIILFPLVWFAPYTLGLVGLDQGLLEAGRGYTRAMAFTLLPMLVVILFRTLLTAAERPKVFLFVTLAVLPLNAAANAAFMLGYLGLPEFGPTGAGISSFIVALAMAIALAAILNREIGRAEGASRVPVPIDWKTIMDVVRVGIPIGIATVADLGIFLGATLYAATLGAADVAAHTIALRLAGVFYAVPVALMQASTVRIARREAGDLDGRRTVIATSITISIAAGILHAGLLAGLAPHVSALVFDGSQVGLTAAGLIFGLVLILGMIEVLETPTATASGLMRGLKDTRAPMAYVLIGYWAISAPLGVLLTRYWQMGITGVWIALAVGTLVTAVLNLQRLKRYWRA